jgi:hypothetical protein
VLQIRVKWCKLTEENATWETLSEFLVDYPNFNLEDKITVNGGSSVRVPHTKAKEKINSIRASPDIEEGRGHRIKSANIRMKDYITK